MSFNKIREKKSNDIISDSDSDSDNESNNESDDNDCNKKTIYEYRETNSESYSENDDNIISGLSISDNNNDDNNDDNISGLNISDNREQTLNEFKEKMNEIFTPEIIVTLRTVNGNTQPPEREYIQLIRNGLNELNFHFEEAGSQQSKDFRNVNYTGLNIEVKKTDKFIIKCNDTCPSEDIEYLIIFTGTNYKTKENIKPQLLFINGQQIIEDCDWLDKFQKILNNFRDTYCRGENKKKLNGAISVYVRPNYDVNIRRFLV